MKQHAILEQIPGEPLHEHVLAAWQGFAWDKRRVTFTDIIWPGELSALQPDPDVPFVGTIKSTVRLLEHWGIEVPKPLNVPDELAFWAGRPIERTTIAGFDPHRLLDQPLFIKPADDVKRWTGDVVHREDQLELLYDGAPAGTAILVSPQIHLVSEHRVFVDRNRQIVTMRHYAGDPFVVPARGWVLELIQAYTQAPCCYALDVGIHELRNGRREPVVVECNDFWALGTYGMDPIAYSRMLAQRWHQLLTTST